MDKFFELHRSSDPLLLANVWDVSSAKMAEKLNFQAIGTSSAAMASILGYKDGELMSFSELVFMVERIRACTSLPLTVDLESGYGDSTEEVLMNIIRLSELGVAGINIEDSKVNGVRTLIDPLELAKRISELKKALDKKRILMFINIRTDSFLIGIPNALEETEERIRIYKDADGIFVPCVENESDIQRIVKCTRLPVNVMCMPNLPDFGSLKQLGVKRISMGNFMYEAMQTRYQELLERVRNHSHFKAVFE